MAKIDFQKLFDVTLDKLAEKKPDGKKLARLPRAAKRKAEGATETPTGETLARSVAKTKPAAPAIEPVIESGGVMEDIAEGGQNAKAFSTLLAKKPRRPRKKQKSDNERDAANEKVMAAMEAGKITAGAAFDRPESIKERADLTDEQMAVLRAAGAIVRDLQGLWRVNQQEIVPQPPPTPPDKGEGDVSPVRRTPGETDQDRPQSTRRRRAPQASSEPPESTPATPGRRRRPTRPAATPAPSEPVADATPPRKPAYPPNPPRRPPVNVAAGAPEPDEPDRGMPDLGPLPPPDIPVVTQYTVHHGGNAPAPPEDEPAEKPAVPIRPPAWPKSPQSKEPTPLVPRRPQSQQPTPPVQPPARPQAPQSKEPTPPARPQAPQPKTPTLPVPQRSQLPQSKEPTPPVSRMPQPQAPQQQAPATPGRFPARPASRNYPLAASAFGGMATTPVTPRPTTGWAQASRQTPTPPDATQQAAAIPPPLPPAPRPTTGWVNAGRGIPVPPSSPTSPPPLPQRQYPPPIPARATVRPAGQAPAGPQPMGFAARVFEYRRNKKERQRRAKELETPVSSETANLTWEERWERAKKKGTLLSTAEVAKRTMAKKPSRQQIVSESEREEQRQRDKARKELEEGQEQASKAVKQFGKALDAIVSGKPGQAIVAFTLGVIAATIAATKLSSVQMEQSRDLQQYSGNFARLFQRMERQRRVLDSRMAGATGVSGEYLGRQIMDLRDTMQPLAQSGRTVANAMMGMASSITAGLVRSIDSSAPGQEFIRFARWLEERLGQNAPPQQNQWVDWFTRTAANGFPGMEQPRNQRPQPPQGPQAGQGGP